MTKIKKQPELADIFRRYGHDYRRNHFLSSEQYKTMRHIEICRTAALAGHIEVCNHCGFEQNAYNSCRDRHCPKCQTLVKENCSMTGRQNYCRARISTMYLRCRMSSTLSF